MYRLGVSHVVKETVTFKYKMPCLNIDSLCQLDNQLDCTMNESYNTNSDLEHGKSCWPLAEWCFIDINCHQ